MSSPLQPLVVGSCQDSARSLGAIERTFSASTHAENALPDESCSAVARQLRLSPLTSVFLRRDSVVHRYRTKHDSLTLAKDFEGGSPTDTLSPLPDSPHPPSLERVKARFASCFLTYFLCGWGDGVTGTVLPYLQADFHLSYMLSSLLFVGTTIGFFLGTFIVERVLDHLGRFDIDKARRSMGHQSPIFLSDTAKGGVGRSPSQARYISLSVSSILLCMHFVMMGSRSGFLVMFLAYADAAFARAFLTASMNKFLAAGPPSSLGYAFAFWSLGGVSSPLVCQTVISAGVPWFHFYFGSLVVAGLSAILVFFTFKPTQREITRDFQLSLNHRRDSSGDSDILPKTTPIELPKPEEVHTFKRACKMPYMWAFNIFILFYCGSETTTQGFMVSYLLGTRNANPNTVGYVTSGFWGGITIGRLVWGYFTASLTFTQRKHILQACVCIALVMHLLIWFVPSNIENALSTGVIGAVYGPIFPGALTQANDVLPPEVQMVSMALISAFGSLGSALFPFVAGTVSSFVGVKTLTYVTVPLAITMVLMWAAFPAHPPRRHIGGGAYTG